MVEYTKPVSLLGTGVGMVSPITGGIISIASNPTDPSTIVSGLASMTPVGSGVAIPAITPILANTASQLLGIPQTGLAPVVASGTTAPTTVQPITTTLQPAAVIVPTSNLTPVTSPTTQSYMNVVQPTSVGYLAPTTQYPTISSLQTQPNYAPMTTGRTPIYDGSQLVGYTEQLSDGSQRVYYVVAGYPKTGMPKAGTYAKGVAVPRARKMNYNRRKPRVTKKKTTAKRKVSPSKKQTQMTARWLGKKLSF